MTDSELIDALERFIQNNGGLVIHNHGYSAKAYPGLGIATTGRTLREALHQALTTQDEEAPHA